MNDFTELLEDLLLEQQEQMQEDTPLQGYFSFMGCFILQYEYDVYDVYDVFIL